MCFSMKRKGREETADKPQSMGLGLFPTVQLKNFQKKKKIGHFYPCRVKKISIYWYIYLHGHI